MSIKNPSRRRFVQAGALGVAGVGSGLAQGCLAALRPVRSLAFSHTHTGERIKVTYADDSGYVPEAVAELNHFLRDFRTGDIHPIALEVLDLLDDARTELAPGAVFEVISGYRSPATNAALQSQGRGVATRSLHLLGRAVDVRLRGVETNILRAWCRQQARGGVGYYPKSDFVHVDNGRVRYW